MGKQFCSAFCLSIFLAAGLNGCSSGGGTAATDQGPELVSLSITPATTSVAVDTDQQFTATGIYADNTTRDLTDSVEWSSSDPAVAVIDSLPDGAALSGSASSVKPGRAYARTEGTTTIRASRGGRSGSADLKVKRSALVSLSLSPTAPGIGKGTTQQFTATGTFSDNTTQDLTNLVKWSSSQTGVATISNTPEPAGLAASIAPGSTVISAMWGAATASTTLTVKQASLLSIAVTPSAPVIAKGTQQQFTATGTYSDSTTQDLTGAVTWTSSDAAVATVSNTPGSSGLATSTSSGAITITAALGNISGAAQFTINPATLISISITPAAPGVAKGTQQQLTATGTYSDNTTQDLTASVAWTSSNTGVASISNAAGSQGLATAIAPGAAAITAASGSIAGTTTLTVNPATLASITVSPSEPAIAKGTDQQFTATGTYSDGTTQNLTASVTWNSSNTAAAAISNAAGSKGLATSVAAGVTTISAVSGGISGTTTLTVNPASLRSLTLTPANPAIAKGTRLQFTAIGTYSDNSTQNLTGSVTWSSSNLAAATISNAAGSNGLATSVAAGTTSIKAVSGSVAVTTTLTVTPATLVSLAVTPANPTVAKGAAQQFTATGTYSDGSTQNLTAAVTWSSSNTAAATISNAAGSQGLASSVAAGSTTIQAVSGTVSRTTGLVVVNRSATLSWDKPLTNTDGTTLTDLAGYKLHYGTGTGNYTTTVTVGNVLTYTVNGMTPGTYYFAVTAVNSSGAESAFSNEAIKTIQ